MNLKTKIIVAFFVGIFLILTVKYFQYKQFKSNETIEALNSIDSTLSAYYFSYWRVPDKKELIQFLDEENNFESKDKVINLLHNSELTITTDSLKNYMLVKLFYANQNIYAEGDILFTQMNFFDFLTQKEIFISQKPIDDVCSYFHYKFFKNGEPVKNDSLKNEMQRILFNLLVKGKETKLNNLGRVMFKVKTISSTKFDIALVCGEVDDKFPLQQLNDSINKIFLDKNISESVDKFYFPLYY